ncbi:MAG: hypothetical protein BGO29_03455 [Bacteroidales bacterium 36-12]|nr:MAG: hypothetical protein BGO29_03455 [Bacteroidales bacterium 36-12]
MKRINNIVVLVATIFSMTSLFAQITTNELPPSFSKSVRTQTDYVFLIPPNMIKILAEDNINDTIPGILRRVAVAIPVLLTAEENGIWSTFSNGDLFWTLSIKVENAQSLDLVFNKFWLPESGRLFIYNKQTRQTIGAVTSEYLQGSKNIPADFSTELILGDELTLEYYQSSTIKEKPVINISKVYYGYRDVDKYNENTRGFGDSGNCQVNINCQEGQNWQNEKEAVARIYVKLPASAGWCSGSLVNNTANNYAPLFLTANHCFSGYFDAINNPNLSQWIFYWNYEFSGCVNQGIQPVLRSTTGALVTANNNISDFALLQLIQDPRNLQGFEPYYLGWDRSGNAGTGGVGIHHPRGDVKKIATLNYPSNNNWNGNNNFWSH